MGQNVHRGTERSLERGKEGYKRVHGGMEGQRRVYKEVCRMACGGVHLYTKSAGYK